MESKVANNIDLQNLLSLLRSKGWDVRKDSVCLGHTFDCVCERKSFLVKWYIIFSFTDTLDQHTGEEMKKVYSDISRRAKSWILGKCFIFCIIADEIDHKVAADLKPDSFGSFGVFRLKGGGGNTFLVDLHSKRIYGKVPMFPRDIHKYSKEIKEILERAI